MSFEHMKSVIGYQGETIRQSKINDAKLVMRKQFRDDPSYRDSFVVWEFGKRPRDFVKLPIKVFDEKYSSSQGFLLKFNTLIEDMLPIGAVVFDTKKSIYYVCTESYDRDEILCSGKLTRCNNWLRWQDSEDKIFDYPVFDLNSTQYNSGTNEGKTVILGSTQHMITITADENTIALDHGKRFFLDRNKTNPTVFKLTQNDTTAMWYDQGLLHITLTEDEYNSKVDSIYDWLCGYVEPDSPTLSVKIAHAGKAEIRTGGTNKTFSVSSSGSVVKMNYLWSAELSNVQKDYVILSPADNQCKVRCLSNEKLVGTKFKLKCICGSKTGEIEITIVGGV